MVSFQPCPDYLQTDSIRGFSFQSSSALSSSFLPPRPGARTSATPRPWRDPPTKNGRAGGKRPDYLLSEAQRERLQALLPKTFPKLLGREPVRVVVLGDTSTVSHGKHFPATTVFMEELAAHFYLTGGVIPINKETGLEATGPSFLVRDLGVSKATVNDAMAHIRRGALAGNPDLVILSYGADDWGRGIPVDAFRNHLLAAALEVNKLGIDLLIMGPPLGRGQPVLQVMAESRIYADAAREVADAAGAAFLDTGLLRNTISGFVLGEEPKPFMDRFFKEIGGSLGLKPSPALEAQLRAKSAYHTLLDGETDRLQVELAKTYVNPDAEVVIEFALRNASKDLQHCIITPLPPRPGLVPLDEPRRFDVGPGEAAYQRFRFQRKDPKTHPYPDNEPVLRVPYVLASTKGVEIEVARAEIRPLGIEFHRRLGVNMGNNAEVGGRVVNRVEKAFEGKFAAAWRGLRVEGKMLLPPRGDTEFKMTLPLPKDRKLFRVFGPVDFVVRGGGQSFVFRRHLEATRNLGLGDRVRLHSERDHRAQGKPLQSFGTGESEAGVFLQVDADDDALYLVYDLGDMPLSGTPANPAIRLSVFLDARQWGERQGMGSIRELKIFFPTGEDESGLVGPLPLGVFGDSYNKILPHDGIGAKLASRPPSGARRVTVTIPRSYFYRHEWALGNGNSQLGIETVLAVLQPGGEADGGTYPPERTYRLLSPRTNGLDPQMLSTIELARPSTGRWSVRVD